MDKIYKKQLQKRFEELFMTKSGKCDDSSYGISDIKKAINELDARHDLNGHIDDDINTLTVELDFYY